MTFVQTVCSLILGFSLCGAPAHRATPSSYDDLEPFQARVVGVHDGDTITVLNDARLQYTIRMANIDAPETKQDYGSRSKQVLSGLVYNKAVTVYPMGGDRYGRLIAEIGVGDLDVNREMVVQGAAWAYRQYLEDRTFLAVEDMARTTKVGLWGVSANPMPPWKWREAKRTKR